LKISNLKQGFALLVIYLTVKVSNTLQRDQLTKGIKNLTTVFRAALKNVCKTSVLGKNVEIQDRF
jgi:hypothetical protein